MVNYIRLANKIAAAKSPPWWIRCGAEFKALQEIVGGWLATTAVIAVSDSASGFALVDKETGERREHDPKEPYYRAKAVEPEQAPAPSGGPGEADEATARALLESLTAHGLVALRRLKAAQDEGEAFKVGARLASKMRELGLMLPDAITLSPLGRQVARLAEKEGR